MPEMEDCIGLTGPEFEFPLELGKQREFAAAAHAFQPHFQDGPHPLMFPTLPIVGSYLWGYMPEEARGTSLVAMGMDGKFAFDGEQEFIFPEGLPRIGEVLTGQVTVEDVWRKTGKRSGELIFYRIRTDYRDRVTGRLRLSNLSTSIVPATVTDTLPHAEPGQISVYMHRNAHRNQFAAIPQADLSQLAEGDTPGDIVMPPHTLTDCVRFQIVAGNYGPGHHDALAARMMGFPTWFGIGMYHASLLANYATSWLPAAALRRFKVRFLDSSWPGDVITYRGHVEAIREETDRKLVDLRLTAARAPDQPIIGGEATFEVPRDDRKGRTA